METCKGGQLGINKRIYNQRIGCKTRSPTFVAEPMNKTMEIFPSQSKSQCHEKMIKTRV